MKFLPRSGYAAEGAQQMLVELKSPNALAPAPTCTAFWVAGLGEGSFILHGWRRNGNWCAARGVVEFLKEALARRGAGPRLRVVRAAAGFFAQELLCFLEARQLPDLVVARMTRGLKAEAARGREWRALDATDAVGEFPLPLGGWDRARRFGAVRERVRETKPAVGPRLVEVPGYAFRVFVPTATDPPEPLGRDYNQRAEMEKRIAELKRELGADDFCLQEFFATEAAFCAILLLFNLRGEFQCAPGMTGYRQPASLRVQVFLWGAMLGRAAQRTILHLSAAGAAWNTATPCSTTCWLMPTRLRRSWVYNPPPEDRAAQPAPVPEAKTDSNFGIRVQPSPALLLQPLLPALDQLAVHPQSAGLTSCSSKRAAFSLRRSSPEKSRFPAAIVFIAGG